MAEPTEPKKRRRRGLKFYLLAALAMTVSTVLVAEIALRIWDPLRLPLEDMRGFYQLDGEGRIETTPGWQGEQFVEGRGVPVHMNALGLRGPEISARVAGEKRVLVLGDSYIWGQGVTDDATVPARLQEQLRAAGHKVTVGNAGMFGAGPREWGYTLTRFREAFEPDVVVAVLYVGNDVQNTLMDPLSVVDGWLMASGTAELRESWRFRLRVWSRLWNTFEKLVAKKRIDQLVIEKLAQERPNIPYRIDEGVFLDRDPSKDDQEPFLRSIEGKLDATFAELETAAAGIPTIVVLLPAYRVVVEDYGKLLTEYGLDAKLHERGRGHDRLQRMLAARGFEVVDLMARFVTAEDRRQLFLQRDWHFSDLGCRRVAGWLLPLVEEHLK
ncbi:MAG: GDSL-type esterase/lipase family protein [bacterium]|nr:GDSL-type esterase/lipase family protein [bacterium]